MMLHVCYYAQHENLPASCNWNDAVIETAAPKFPDEIEGLRKKISAYHTAKYDLSLAHPPRVTIVSWIAI